MSYLGPPYSHDIFVSYSHGPVGSAKLREYSRALIRDLEDELRTFSHLGGKLSIYFDTSEDPEQGLNPMRHLADQLERGARGAGLLVVLMSDHYLGSRKWCPEERRWWFDEQRARKLAPDNRVAAVSIWRLPPEAQWPADLCDPQGERLPGITFVPATGPGPQPLGWPHPDRSTTDREYCATLVNLANHVERALTTFREQVEAERTRARHAAKLGSDPLVYLFGRDEQSAEWSRVRSSLATSGIEALPLALTGPDLGASEFQKARQLRIETMSGTDALFLVGGSDPRAVEADLVSIGRLDRHAAISRSNRDLPCAFLDVAHVGQNNPVLQDVARRIGIDWLEAANGPWPQQARQWLAQASATGTAT